MPGALGPMRGGLGRHLEEAAEEGGAEERLCRALCGESFWLGTEVLKESTQSWGSVDEMTQQGRSREPHRRFCVLSRLLDALKDLRQREGVM